MNKKVDFLPFKVGTVFNPIDLQSLDLRPKFKTIEIKYPSRLNAMALDPSKIAANDNLQYSPGEIILKIQIYKKVKVSIIDNGGIIIDEKSKRHSLIKHATLLMRKALNVSDGYGIEVENENEIRHAGLGSSSGLISSVACAINEIYGNPISPDDLIQYLAQNHGEEIDGEPNLLSPVQCIGGSAAAGLSSGGLIVLAGKNRVIAHMNIGNEYAAVIGIPSDFKELDSQDLLKEEIKNFDKFIQCGKKYGSLISYRMLHSVLPAMTQGDIRPLGDLVFDYRFDMGSIENCSYCYSRLPEIAQSIRFLKEDGVADMLAISSVGPAFFAITKQPEKCSEIFQREGMVTHTAEIDNQRYQVLNRSIFTKKL